MVTMIKHGGRLLAIIVSHDYSKSGITFFTPNELSQQLAYMHHPVGKLIEPHVHNPVPRNVQFTQETLFIKRGQLRVDFSLGFDLDVITHLTQKIVRRARSTARACGDLGRAGIVDLDA